MDVVVVGSIHRDLVLRVAHHPADGETVLASDAQHVGGGKGANQAVAAARLGASVALVGRVGRDPDGSDVRAALARDGLDLRHLVVDGDAATGTAVVMVDRTGENRIVVAPGASGRLAPADVEVAGDLVRHARVVALQQEVPPETVLAAARLATGVVQLDPAPATAVDAELLEHVGLLVPNELELAQLAGEATAPAAHAARDPEAITRWARGLRERLGRPPRAVLVTLGGRGALLVADGRPRHLPAPPVEVRDTTAAGDAFRGAMACELAHGTSLEEAASVAVRAGAAAAAGIGAQPSLPTAADLPPAAG